MYPGRVAQFIQCSLVCSLTIQGLDPVEHDTWNKSLVVILNTASETLSVYYF